MSWLLADLIMFACSVSLYLAVRKAALLKLAGQFSNLAMFAIPALIFLVAALATHARLSLTWWQFIQIAGTSIVLCYYGNAMSIRSIELAPNAGYSLVLSKSYVVLTTLLAVPLFGAHLSARALIGVGVIVLSSALIMINPKRNSQAKGAAWVPLAFGSFLCWAFLSLMAKHLISGGIPTITFLLYVFVIATPCILFEMRHRNIALRVTRRQAWPFVVVGLTAAGFNFFNFYALSIAPNVGYVNATNAASIGVVTLLSAVFFKDELTKQKLVGVFGVVAGLVVLLAHK